MKEYFLYDLCKIKFQVSKRDRRLKKKFVVILRKGGERESKRERERERERESERERVRE